MIPLNFRPDQGLWSASVAFSCAGMAHLMCGPVTRYAEGSSMKDDAGARLCQRLAPLVSLPMIGLGLWQLRSRPGRTRLFRLTGCGKPNGGKQR
jgi:hypothetical protein